MAKLFILLALLALAEAFHVRPTLARQLAPSATRPLVRSFPLMEAPEPASDAAPAYDDEERMGDEPASAGSEADGPDMTKSLGIFAALAVALVVFRGGDLGISMPAM